MTAREQGDLVTGDLAYVRKAKTILLTTYKRDGMARRSARP